MDNEPKKLIKRPGCILAIIIFFLMGVVSENMYSPQTNFLQGILMWIGGTVVMLALWFLIVHLLEKDNK